MGKGRKQATCHPDAEQQAGHLAAQEKESVFIFGVGSASIFPRPASRGSAGSLGLPGASLDATVSSLLLQPSTPLQRGLMAKHPLVLVLGNIPFPANTLLTLVFAVRRRNYQFPRPGGGSRAAWGTCMGRGAGMVEAQESQNWAFPVRQGFLLELD